MEDKKEFIEIDILSFFQKIWNKKLLIILMTIIGTVAALIYSEVCIPTLYQSESTIYVFKPASNEKIKLYDIQLSSQLAKDYQKIIYSEDVLSEVIKREKLEMTENELKKMISVNIPEGSRFVTITVTDKSPDHVSSIAKNLAEVSIGYFKKITKVNNVPLINEGTEPIAKRTPSLKKVVLLGTVAGFVLSLGWVLVNEFMTAKIVTREDIEETVDATILGVITKK